MGKLLIAKDAAEKALAAETCRAECQVRNAWKFVAATLVAIGFQLRDAKALVESPSPWVKALCCVSLAALAAALVLACRALQTTGHGHYPRGNKLWENLKPEDVSEADANEALVQILLLTREQNARLNDAKDGALRWCGWLFLAGLLLVTGCQLIDAFVDWT